MQTIDAAHLAATYDALFIDAYGVLVDAHGALPDAARFVHFLQRRALPFVIVTNDASKSLARIAARFAALAMPIRRLRPPLPSKVSASSTPQTSTSTNLNFPWPNGCSTSWVNPAESSSAKTEPRPTKRR